jgi:hypothetical protein
MIEIAYGDSCISGDKEPKSISVGDGDGDGGISPAKRTTSFIDGSEKGCLAIEAGAGGS